MADFGFSDPNDIPANTLSAVEITSFPARALTVAVALLNAGDFSLADIAAGNLLLYPGGRCQRGGLRSLHLPGARRRRHGQRRGGSGRHAQDA